MKTRRPLRKNFQDRLEDQRKAKEDNLARFKKQKESTRKAIRKKSNTKPNHCVDDSNPQVQRKKEPTTQIEYNALFADERDELLEYLPPQVTYSSLARDAALCAAQNNICVRLIWPAFPSCVPAIHSIASCEAYESGNQLGLRAILWPAKANSFRELNHIRIDARWLYGVAQYWQSLKSHKPESYAELIKSKCTHKDILFLSLSHYLDDEGDPRGFPSIGEAFATFPVGRTIWGDFTKKIFNGVFSHVSRKGIPLADLGDPCTAPDAIFGIHPDATIEEIVDRFTTDALSPNKGRPPDFVIINLCAKSRSWLGGSWIKKTIRVLQMLGGGLPSAPIGALVLIDDPLAYLAFMSKLNGRSVRGKRKASVEQQVNAASKLCLSDSITIRPEKNSRTISDTTVLAHIVDAEAAAVAAAMYKTAKTIQGESEALSGALRSCAGYILWSARLPCGQTALQEMLHEDSRSDQELQWRTRMYSWRGVVNELQNIRSALGDADGTSNIDRLLESASSLLDSYSAGTPSGMKLIELVDEIMAQTVDARSKHKKRSKPTVTIAVPSALQVRLVMRVIEERWPLYDSVGNEVIQILRTIELFSRSAPVIARRLIVVGAHAQTIAELCSAQSLPRRIELILSAGDAERIVRTLTYVLGDDEFKSLHNPIKDLVRKLSEFLESDSTSYSLLNRLVYWHPQTHTDTGSLDWNTATSIVDFRFDLDDGRIIGMRKSSPTLVYDESRRPPYIQKTAAELRVGDHFLDISDEMRDDIEVYMDLAGRFKSEGVVRAFHRHVVDKLNEQFPDQTVSQRINNLRQRFNDVFPNETEITDAKIRYWVTVGQEINLPFEDLVSHAPKAKSDFEMFMRVLNIDEPYPELYWGLGINSLRTDRRHEGRQATLVYQRLLLDPVSVASLLSIPSSELARLQTQARLNVVEILRKERIG